MVKWLPHDVNRALSYFERLGISYRYRIFRIQWYVKDIFSVGIFAQSHYPLLYPDNNEAEIV